MRLLLDEGGDVNVRDVDSNTTLDIAILKGHEEAVSLLKEYSETVEKYKLFK